MFGLVSDRRIRSSSRVVGSGKLRRRRRRTISGSSVVVGEKTVSLIQEN